MDVLFLPKFESGNGDCEVPQPPPSSPRPETSKSELQRRDELINFLCNSASVLGVPIPTQEIETEAETEVEIVETETETETDEVVIGEIVVRSPRKRKTIPGQPRPETPEGDLKTPVVFVRPVQASNRKLAPLRAFPVEPEVRIEDVQVRVPQNNCVRLKKTYGPPLSPTGKETTEKETQTTKEQDWIHSSPKKVRKTNTPLKKQPAETGDLRALHPPVTEEVRASSREFWNEQLQEGLRNGVIRDPSLHYDF
jgi:hypothetical protein